MATLGVDIPAPSDEKRDIVNLYFDATAEAATRRNQTYRVMFKGEEHNAEADTPGERAVNEYYLGMEEAKTPAGNFDSDRWNAILDRLEVKWAREGTLEYVRSETHTTKVSENLLRILPEKTQLRIRLSQQARERYQKQLEREMERER